jgi:hypothetical protein
MQSPNGRDYAATAGRAGDIAGGPPERLTPPA